MNINFVVVGAGAIGAFVGAALAKGGADVTLVARGPHLKAIQEKGLTILHDRESFRTEIPATDDLAAVSEADVVFLSVKSHGVAPIARALADSMDRDTVIITAQNGIPWWYFQGLSGPFEDRVVESVDPGGRILQLIDPQQVLGCVMYCSAEISSPGVVRHIEGTRFILGEPSGEATKRCRNIAKAFVEGGLKSSASTDIREQIWLKAIGNVAFNPVSVLTRATLAEMGSSEDLRVLLRSMMEEVAEVANSLGVSIRVSIDRRLEGGFAVGEHKTSMLQDLEAGRPLEVESLTGAILELAQLSHVPVPFIRAIHACVDMLTRRTATEGGSFNE